MRKLLWPILVVTWPLVWLATAGMVLWTALHNYVTEDD